MDTNVALTDADMEGSGVGNKDVALRLQIQLSSMVQAVIYLSIIPIHKANLPAMCAKWNLSEGAGAWPIRVGYFMDDEKSEGSSE